MLWVSKAPSLCGERCGLRRVLLLSRADEGVVLQSHLTGQGLATVRLRAVGVDQVSS